MGGMQVLQWAASYPDRVFSALPIAAAARHSAQNIAFHEVGRQAIMADPDWRGGNYLNEGTRPAKGLGVARMGAHITYLSELALHRKFGRNFQDRTAPTFSFDADFQIESYLRYQGLQFVERFDANSYLYVTPRHGLLRPRGGARRTPGAGFQGLGDAVLRDLVHVRLALSRPPIPAPSFMRSTRRRPPSASSRSRATRATTPSCSTSPKCSPPPAVSSTPPRARGAFA